MKRQLALLAGALLLGACNPNLTELGRQEAPATSGNETPAEEPQDQQNQQKPPPLTPVPATCNWSQTAAPIGSEIRGVFASPDVRMVSTESAVYRSADGLSWTELSGAPRPLDHFDMVGFYGFLYATTGRWNGGVLVSEDLGLTWAELNAGFEAFPRVEQLVTDGSTLLARTYGKLYRLTGEGTAWAEVATPQRLANVGLADGVWFASGADGAWLRSTDSGTTWNVASNAHAPNLRFPLVKADDGVYGIRTGETVVVSKDGGVTWQQVPNPLTVAFGPNRIGLHDGRPVAVYYGGVYRLESAEWVAVGPEGLRGNAEGISHLVSDGTSLFAGTYASGLLRIAPGAEQWDRPANIPGGPARAVAGDGQRLYVSSTPHEIQVSDDHGESFTSVRTGLDKDSVIAELAVAPGAVYAGTYSHGMYRSTDHGQSWQAINNGYPTYESTNGFKHREVGGIAIGESAIVVGTAIGNESWGGKGHAYNSAGLWRSLDGGNTWMAANGGIAVTGYGNDGAPRYYQTEAVASIGGKRFVMSMASLGLFRSDDDGASWTPVNTGVPSDALGHYARFESILRAGDAIFAAGWDMVDNTLRAILLRSDDGGQTWTPATHGLPLNRKVRDLETVGGVLYASMGHADSHDPADGVYVSWDLGESWSMASKLAPTAHVGRLHATPGALFGATDLNGLQRLALGVCE